MQLRTMVLGSCLCLLLAAPIACSKKSAGVPDPSRQSDATPPTLAELRNATYRGLGVMTEPVQLVDGQWEGKPAAAGGASRPTVHFVRDFRLLGDLDGDGAEEAAVLLGESGGGSGSFSSLAVVGRRSGRLQNLSTAPLGDRVQVRGGRIEGRNIILDVVQAGPNDAACCPGDLVTRTWWLGAEGLSELAASTPAGRLSLATLAGSEWVLRAWDWNEPADATPAITLQFQDGRFAGTSACNRYGAPVTANTTPGDITVGPGMGTRMACPEPIMAAEDRYLKLLSRVKKFGFMAGELVLTYEKDAGMGTMFFAGRPLQP